MSYAALLFSTIAKGRIAELDVAEAAAAPGVILVMTHKNAPPMKPMPLFMTDAKAAGGDNLPVMQDDRIHWNGQPIALVLAETQEQADHAKSLIRVTFDTERAITSFEAAKAAGTDQIYRTPRHAHNAIEPHAATVSWSGDDLIVHDATQAVVHTAWSLAQVFDIDEKQVHVTSPYVGGGFGSKTLWQHQVLGAAAAKLAGRPVRIALSREGVYRTVGGRSQTEQRVAIGAKNDGHFTAILHTGTTVMTRNNAMPEPFIVATRSGYAADTFKLQVEVAYMDMLANTFMRAPGEAVGTFGLECAIDELADRLGIDPIELRLHNEPDKDPTGGAPFSARHIVEAYKSGAARFGWDKRGKPGARREGEWLIGLGCATATYPYYRMPGGAARITLKPDGHATVAVAAHEMGMGTATTQTIVLAERLGLPLDHVSVEYGDSILPGLVLAGGS